MGVGPGGPLLQPTKGQLPSVLGEEWGLGVCFRRRGGRVGKAAGALLCRQGHRSSMAGTLATAVSA